MTHFHDARLITLYVVSRLAQFSRCAALFGRLGRCLKLIDQSSKFSTLPVIG